MMTATTDYANATRGDVLIKHQRQAREGFSGEFDRSIAGIHAVYGDDLYRHGRRHAAREQWRRAFTMGCDMGAKDRAVRLLKSYCPPGVLAVGRKWSAWRRGDATGTAAAHASSLAPASSSEK